MLLPDKIFLDVKSLGFPVSTNATVIGVMLEKTGFWPINTNATAAELNGQDVTPEILEAAMAASLFGWDVPAAKPAFDFLARRLNGNNHHV